MIVKQTVSRHSKIMKKIINLISTNFICLINLSLLIVSLSVAANSEVISIPVWSVNVGGESYTDINGTVFTADICNQKTMCHKVSAIKGTHSQPLYTTYQIGNLGFDQEVENGLYDITLHFMEPNNTPVGQRRFDVLVEDNTEISSLDIRGLRDGKIRSALSRTIPNIKVSDGALNINLRGINGLPVISGFEVHRRYERQEQNWHLFWHDEFDRDGQIDPANWSFNIWPAGKVNNEDQTYTDRTTNLRIEDGLLVIEAHREKFRGAEYTSARIHSAGKLDLLYGKIEVSARLPKGQGTWPAIWMLPSNPFRYSTTCAPDDDWQGSKTCDAWPNSGEIDIMEHVGFDPNIVHGTVHTKSNYWRNWNQHKGSIQLEDVHKHFYRYGLIWTADSITATVNDIPYFTYHRTANNWQQWPFDSPFNIILNLAIGGNWGRAGGPIDNSAFPLRMEVDYVRVYKSTSIESAARDK